MRKTHMQELVDAGYEVAMKGQPCEAPTSRELDRSAWETGWRDGHKIKGRIDHAKISAEGQRMCIGSVAVTVTDGEVKVTSTVDGFKVWVWGIEV